MDIMLDSGSSVSLIRKDMANQMKNPTVLLPSVRPSLVTASGDPLPVIDYIQGVVAIGRLEALHNFSVVSDLITPAILGVDFLQQHGLSLDFSTVPLSVVSARQKNSTAIISPGLPSDRPPEQPPDRPPEQPPDRPPEQPSEQPPNRPPEQPSDRPPEQPADRPSEQPSDRPPEQPPDRPPDRLSEQPSDRPPEQPSDRPDNPIPEALQPILQQESKHRVKVCVTAMVSDSDTMVEDSQIPIFGGTVAYDLPECTDATFATVLEEYKDLFRTVPGQATGVFHHIPTTGSPVKVPPRRIPAHFKEKVETLLDEMRQQGIIEESSSPWMAPAVCVPKKSGEVRLCIDYRELNKRTVKDAYPLPLPDEVQDRLANSSIFLTLDLQNGYWQLPVQSNDCEKTAFCPGPGMGLYQFTRMPFGLTGAPSSFQRLMDHILREFPFVSRYIDDILIHSLTMELHIHHLKLVLEKLRKANLTLRGRKCKIGQPEVYYLGHVFSKSGMRPDGSKIKAVRDWPQPTDASDIRRFLGLASYYRRYIQNFSDVAAPLSQLTQKGVLFCWSEACERAFLALKTKLTQAPILAYPQLCQTASPFVLQTDASDVGLGAVLEQDKKVIAYASRTLTKPEKHYSCDAKSHALGVCHTHLAYTSSSHAYLLNPPAFLQSPATSRHLLCIRVFQFLDEVRV